MGLTTFGVHNSSDKNEVSAVKGLLLQFGTMEKITGSVIVYY